METKEETMNKTKRKKLNGHRSSEIDKARGPGSANELFRLISRKMLESKMNNCLWFNACEIAETLRPWTSQAIPQLRDWQEADKRFEELMDGLQKNRDLTKFNAIEGFVMEDRVIYLAIGFMLGLRAEGQGGNASHWQPYYLSPEINDPGKPKSVSPAAAYHERKTPMKNWTEEPYMYPKNILRVRTRKSRSGELLKSARKLDVESVQIQKLCAGDWVVAMFRHQPGVGQVTGIVRNSRGRKILAPVSYVFNPKLAKWKPGPIDLRQLGQLWRIKHMEMRIETLERAAAILREAVPAKARELQRIVRAAERRL